jgi:hypothetical protein
MLVAVGEQLNPNDVDGETLAHAMCGWDLDAFQAMRTTPAFPAGCQSRRRMEEVMGLSPDTCLNLAAPGEVWQPHVARERAGYVRSWASARDYRLALMGRRVAAAFDLGRAPFGTFALTPVPTIVLPHPSGLSRFLNSHDNRTKIRRAVETFDRCFPGIIDS